MHQHTASAGELNTCQEDITDQSIIQGHKVQTQLNEAAASGDIVLVRSALEKGVIIGFDRA